MRTLLRVPDLVVAVEPIVGSQVATDEIFRLIGSNVIEPFGIVQRMPVFELNQIGEVAEKIRTARREPKIGTGEGSDE